MSGEYRTPCTIRQPPSMGTRMPLPPFVAIDFETSNRAPISACALGMIRVDGRIVTVRHYELIRPPGGPWIFTL